MVFGAVLWMVARLMVVSVIVWMIIMMIVGMVLGKRHRAYKACA